MYKNMFRATSLFAFVVAQGCAVPPVDYNLANPCTELTAEVGGTAADFMTPTSIDSFTLSEKGLLVDFTATCIPAGYEPQLTVRLGYGVYATEATLSGAEICTSSDADPYGSANWDCRTVLPVLDLDPIETEGLCDGDGNQSLIKLEMVEPGGTEPILLNQVYSTFPVLP